MQFARTFLMPRRIFLELINLFRHDFESDDPQTRRYSGGRVEPAVRLAITMRLLAGGSYIDLVTNYNIAPATVYDIFHDKVQNLFSRIAMPNIDIQDEAALHKLAEEFQTSRSTSNPLYGCVGIVDGICLRVIKHHAEYIPRKVFCRKGMYAIPVQAVISSSYKFLYMSSLCAGSTNDCTAFAVIRLAGRLRTIGIVTGFWIAGVAAHECLNRILTPCS